MGSRILLRRRFLAALVLIPISTYFLWSSISGAASLSCGSNDGERFMWYAPHSGFSNQIGELRNAFRIAAILGRTLVVPPVTDHHALSLGSCPKYRIVQPSDLRESAWSHFDELIQQSRYYSIADVLNVSSVVPKYVKAIDLRVFARLWCGSDVLPACTGTLCKHKKIQVKSSFKQCGSMVTGVDEQCKGLVQVVDHNCATIRWRYAAQGPRRRNLLSSKLRTKKFSGPRMELDINETLGSHTRAGKARLLAFGSLFSASYGGEETHIDIKPASASANSHFAEVYRRTTYFPFANPILDAGKLFVEQRIGSRRYFCAQLRLLDGQFKNHWSKTFKELKSRLEALSSRSAVFLMTDLPRRNWSGTYLEQVASHYDVYTLEEGDELVTKTARNLLREDQSNRNGLSRKDEQQHQGWASSEVLLFLQETICSCAQSGFQGTAGSTITENILQMMTYGSCSLS